MLGFRVHQGPTKQPRKIVIRQIPFCPIVGASPLFYKDLGYSEGELHLCLQLSYC